MDPGERAFAELRRMVDAHGWAIRHVLGNSSAAPFSYTVGLTAKGWDELLITGLPAEVADVFIRNAVDEQDSSGAFRAGDRTEALTESGSVAFIRVEDRSGLTAAGRMLGDFEALQMVWPDSNDNFPWDIGYRNPPTAQPLLGPASRPDRAL
ncbi:DUF4262 domain-containing protein [Microbacterium sp. ASV81]|uniref:DUF4262 domain-containing protein n=1 Tax=Microbacterium capsulatum TaxID=3041921 RepID=A0ABU0XHB4_9MICO|nr:DUF4262 domain-containing protein [Microbacterium sp. ASV81]MDQ4213963.1 DUF4262 domain-containing protein [Microbacterium sp. ASV81]